MGGSNRAVKAQPAPVSLYQPPVTSTAGEVQTAQRDTLRAAKKRRGFGNAINAGETFSGGAYQSNVGANTLLGSG